MKRVRVLIATTIEPSEIRLLEFVPTKGRKLACGVCLEKKTGELPISSDYDEFVKEPTGVIERFWGGDTFRLEVSKIVETGESWKLGIALAHALKADDRLAEKSQSADVVVLATGVVTHELVVEEVDYVPEKLIAATDEIIKAQANGAKVVILVPFGNAADAALSVFDGTGVDCNSLQVKAVQNVEEACLFLGIPAPSIQIPAPPPDFPPTPSPNHGTGVPPPPPPVQPLARGSQSHSTSRPFLTKLAALLSAHTASAKTKKIIGASVSVAAIIACLGWAYAASGAQNLFALAKEGRYEVLEGALTEADGGCLLCRLGAAYVRRSLSGDRPDIARMDIEVIERVAKTGECGTDSGQWESMHPVTVDADHIASNGNHTTCAIEYRLINRGGPAHVWAAAMSAGMPAPILASDSRMMMPDGGAAVLSPSRIPAHDGSISIVAVVAYRPLTNAKDWLGRIVPNTDPALLDRRLSSLGLGLKVLSHQLGAARSSSSLLQADSGTKNADAQPPLSESLPKSPAIQPHPIAPQTQTKIKSVPSQPRQKEISPIPRKPKVEKPSQTNTSPPAESSRRPEAEPSPPKEIFSAPRKPNQEPKPDAIPPEKSEFWNAPKRPTQHPDMDKW